MYQQPMTHTLTTEEFVRNFHEDAKLTAQDALMTLAQVAGALGSCWVLHAAVM